MTCGDINKDIYFGWMITLVDVHYPFQLADIATDETMQAQSELLRLSSANLLFPSLSPSPFPHYLCLSSRPINYHYSLCSAHKAWLAQLSEQLATTAPGPTELPTTFLLAADDKSLQTATSILLTGAFLSSFSALSAAAPKKLKEKALNKASNAAIKGPSADEAFLGALIAAAFGVLLYKFTTSVEYTLNHQVLSNNYSVRQITITIRTIINGLCYLATFVFGFNSLGLFLYSGQLALNSNLPNHSTSSSACVSDDQSSDNTQK